MVEKLREAAAIFEREGDQKAAEQTIKLAQKIEGQRTPKKSRSAERIVYECIDTVDQAGPVDLVYIREAAEIFDVPKTTLARRIQEWGLTVYLNPKASIRRYVAREALEMHFSQPSVTETKEFITIKEATIRFDQPKTTIQRGIRKNQIPTFKNERNRHFTYVRVDDLTNIFGQPTVSESNNLPQ